MAWAASKVKITNAKQTKLNKKQYSTHDPFLYHDNAKKYKEVQWNSEKMAQVTLNCYDLKPSHHEKANKPPGLHKIILCKPNCHKDQLHECLFGVG